MGFPAELAFDSLSKQLFVPDFYNNRVVVFDGATSTIANGENALAEVGQYTTSTAPTGNPDYAANTANSGAGSINAFGLSSPKSAAIDPVGHRLFVADQSNNRVLVFSLTAANTIATSSVSASYVLGQPNFTSNAATATASGLNDPVGVAYNAAAQYLYVSDFNNGRIMVFNVATSTIMSPTPPLALST